MGLQLIIVMETNPKAKTDWVYIKETIDAFYEVDQAHVKLSPVYMNGKGKYKSKEKEVIGLINKYNFSSKNNKSVVLYCFDCDEYDSDNADKEFITKAEKFCNDNNYDFAWFCKDIERVYWGKKVEDKEKQKESVVFKTKKVIKTVNVERLSKKSFENNSSNIMAVLDRYLVRK